MGHLQKILDRFRGKRVMVIGDSMLDKYVWGEVSRISPEAPVQVVDVQRESYAPGGATNVAMNAAALGARVRMMGITGDDEARKVLLRLLEEGGISVEGMLIEKDKPTTLKMRVMARSQQLLRVDYEKRAHSHPEIEKRLIAAVAESVDGTDAIIISDYAKGVVTKKLMETLLGMARKERLSSSIRSRSTRGSTKGRRSSPPTMRKHARWRTRSWTTATASRRWAGSSPKSSTRTSCSPGGRRGCPCAGKTAGSSPSRRGPRKCMTSPARGTPSSRQPRSPSRQG